MGHVDGGNDSPKDDKRVCMPFYGFAPLRLICVLVGAFPFDLGENVEANDDLFRGLCLWKIREMTLSFLKPSMPRKNWLQTCWTSSVSIFKVYIRLCVLFFVGLLRTRVRFFSVTETL